MTYDFERALEAVLGGVLIWTIAVVICGKFKRNMSCLTMPAIIKGTASQMTMVLGAQMASTALRALEVLALIEVISGFFFLDALPTACACIEIAGGHVFNTLLGGNSSSPALVAVEVFQSTFGLVIFSVAA
jgi:hypothetical protein